MERRYDTGSTPSTLEAALKEFFPDDLAQWLLKEMQQNRNRALESQKVLNAACLCTTGLTCQEQLNADLEFMCMFMHTAVSD